MYVLWPILNAQNCWQNFTKIFYQDINPTKPNQQPPLGVKKRTKTPSLPHISF
jgi:hypothetical protein